MFLCGIPVLRSCVLFTFISAVSFYAQDNTKAFQDLKIYVPLINTKESVPCKVLDYCKNKQCIQFIKHNQNNYLKVIFGAEKDTLFGTAVEKYKSEIEIQSGTKTYYKKEWSIFKETNQLFFVVLLPSNYLKTLSSDGITEILVNNQSVVSFSKKETRQIKDMATTILNNQ